MGFIIIDEDKLRNNLSLWNDRQYYQHAMYDVTSARVSSDRLLAALTQEQAEIRADIAKLQEKEQSVEHMMMFARANSQSAGQG